ncbi:MAG TPA: hypothetical protein VEG60_09120 [Candidatus Binatia bacterium]|nr:hypothetical protein [Candidatus Binatia bacterium]
MKTNKYIAVFSLLTALAFSLSYSLADAGQGAKGSQRGGQAKSHMSSKGAANTNAQWSADPEKGWVRAEERHQRGEESHDKSTVKKNSGKHTAKGKKEK